MKNTKIMLTGISFLTLMFLASCGKSPQEKLVGEWEKGGDICVFNSDGTMNMNGESGIWEIKKVLVLKIGEGKKAINFISDDEIEILFAREPNLIRK